MSQTICACAICREDITQEQMEAKTLADNKVYDWEGDLDYIELAHRDCARREDPEGHSWEWDEDPADAVRDEAYEADAAFNEARDFPYAAWEDAIGALPKSQGRSVFLTPGADTLRHFPRFIGSRIH